MFFGGGKGKPNPALPTLKELEEEKLVEDVWLSTADDYEIEGLVGRGAYANVFAAKCLSKGGLSVAVKVIELEHVSGDEPSVSEQSGTATTSPRAASPASLAGIDTERIAREAAVLKSMKHSNCLGSFTSFIVGAELWVVMPLISGGSCLDVMRKTQCFGGGFKDHLLLATLLRDIVAGVEYCHQNGRVHRDIKAANVLIADSGRAKLSDFGVSGAIIEGGLRKMGRHTFTGSLWWMAPEVLQREGIHSYAADIWSIGITALELAFGKPPHSEQRPVKVMLTVLQSEPPTEALFPKDDVFSADRSHKKFRSFVCKCLQKSPAKRPSAKELLSDGFLKLAKEPQYVIDNVIAKLSRMSMKTGSHYLPLSVRKKRKGKMPVVSAADDSHFDFQTSISRTAAIEAAMKNDSEGIELKRGDSEKLGRFEVEAISDSFDVVSEASISEETGNTLATDNLATDANEAGTEAKATSVKKGRFTVSAGSVEISVSELLSEECDDDSLQSEGSPDKNRESLL